MAGFLPEHDGKVNVTLKEVLNSLCQFSWSIAPQLNF